MSVISVQHTWVISCEATALFSDGPTDSPITIAGLGASSLLLAYQLPIKLNFIAQNFSSQIKSIFQQLLFLKTCQDAYQRKATFLRSAHTEKLKITYMDPN